MTRRTFIATGGVGSSLHLAGEAFIVKDDVARRSKRVRYSGATPE